MESNFSEAVLEELRDSGCNVQLLIEYTTLYRQHVKDLLQRNIKKQHDLAEVNNNIDLTLLI